MQPKYKLKEKLFYENVTQTIFGITEKINLETDEVEILYHLYYENEKHEYITEVDEKILEE